MPICKQCKEEKNETDFHINKSKENGHCQDCKKCKLSHQTNYRNVFKKVNESHSCINDGCFTKTKFCKQCKVNHKLFLYKIDKGRKDSHFSTCRYYQIKEDAKRFNREFTLTLQEYEFIICQPCFYSNYHTTKNNLVGIDRVDNSKGYIKSNVVPCCWPCNDSKKAKSGIEYIEFLQSFMSSEGKDYATLDKKKQQLLTHYLNDAFVFQEP